MVEDEYWQMQDADSSVPSPDRDDAAMARRRHINPPTDTAGNEDERPVTQPHRKSASKEAIGKFFGTGE